MHNFQKANASHFSRHSTTNFLHSLVSSRPNERLTKTIFTITDIILKLGGS